MRRVAVAVAVVAVVAGLFVAVFPTQAMLDQRKEHRALASQVARMTKHNDVLQAQARKLEDDAEIERLAREQYNLVKPGEEAYALLPSPPPVEAAKPSVTGKAKPVRHPWWKRAWNAVTGVV